MELNINPMLKSNSPYMRMIREQQKAESFQQLHERFVISPEVIMYSINDVIRITGWSRKVVQRLFNDPKFPAVDYGKAKLVEAHAFIEFMSVRHERDKEEYWINESKKAAERKIRR